MRATGSGGAKTIYSPIKRQTQQQAQHPVIDGDATINDSSSSFELDYNTQQQQQQQTRQQPYHDYNHYQNQPVESREFEIGQTPVEEVYIYNCCGLTSELNPSIKFMSAYRCIFFLFNFLVFAFGLANFGMGLWFRIDPKVYEIHKYIETQNFTYAGWIILVGGFLACLMSLIGFVATSRQLISLSVLYISILILLTIAFVGALVLMIVYGLGDTLEQFMVKEIYEQMRRRSMNMELDAMMTNEAAQFIDFVQVKMRCCGATDFRDYMKLGMTIPTTCHTIDRNFINAHVSAIIDVYL